MSLDLSPDSSRIISLISYEGTPYEIPLDYINCSTLIKTSLESDEDSNELKLIVKDRELSLICDLLNHYKENLPETLQPPLRDRIFKDIVDPYSFKILSQFIYEEDSLSKIKKEFYDLFSASNYLGFDYLTQLCAAFVADFIRDVKEEDLEKVL
jgi:hypothetical protein